MLFRLSDALVAVSVLASAANAQSQTNYPITGISVPSGQSAPLRRNINDLYSAGGATWDLYIRSLVAMYAQDASSQLSFFQIAGIHGRPYIQWNGAGAETSNGWEGYCPHGENLFLSWHRPYLSLFEMQLVATAKSLANAYPSNVRATYQAAANNLRAPYWDWALSSTVPAATAPNTLTVNGPSGRITVTNPLRIYKFPQKALNQQFGSFSTAPQIYKCRAPSSYPAGANAAMAKRSYRSWTYDALTSSTTFAQFASTGSSGVSLESIHNAIHWDGSCGQQFLDADYSGFDPLFMLHHANVDRLWAYWQAMRPEQSTFSGSYSGGARFNTRQGTTITTSSPLQPFYQSAGRFHTSQSVNSIYTFGYAYEGIESTKSAAQRKSGATALVNRLYGTGSSVSKAKRDGTEKLVRYFVNVNVNVEELERPCTINLYANTTMVGNFIVMMQPPTGTSYAKFGLDDAANPQEVLGENVTNVVDTLKASLRIEILKRDGTAINITSVPSLTLNIENVDVVPPTSETKLPVYSDAEQHRAPKKQLGSPPSKSDEKLSDSYSSSYSKSSSESNSKSSSESSSTSTDENGTSTDSSKSSDESSSKSESVSASVKFGSA